MTKTKAELAAFKNTLENCLMELMCFGQAGVPQITVEEVGWTVGLTRGESWKVVFGNVDRQTEVQMMQQLNVLTRQTAYGKDDMDVYSEWADESNTGHEAASGAS